MMPKLEPKTLESLSDIEVTFSLGEHSGGSYPQAVLVIACRGSYRSCSSGNPDAVYLTAMGGAGIRAFSPHGVILDLRELSYRGGDMLAAFLAVGADRPHALVVGERCRLAIGTLCFGEESVVDACQAEGVFDSLSEAWAYVTARLAQSTNFDLVEKSFRAGGPTAWLRMPIRGGLALRSAHPRRDLIG